MLPRPDRPDWWVVTPDRFPRTLWGVRFRWPAWWEWLLLTLLSFALLRSGWAWLFGVLWAWMALRQGALLTWQRPLRSAGVALVVLAAVNAGVLALLLLGALLARLFSA